MSVRWTVPVVVSVPGDWQQPDGAVDLFASSTTSAVLTTEHASSSHGLPVLVVDGGVRGPADLEARASILIDSGEPAAAAVAAAARDAGYDVQMIGEPGDDQVTHMPGGGTTY